MKKPLIAFTCLIGLVAGMATGAPTTGSGGGGGASCVEDWVEFVENGAHTHSILTGLGGQLNHAPADFIKSFSDPGWGNCWVHDPGGGGSKTGVQFNAAQTGCTASDPVSVRFDYVTTGKSSVANAVLNTFMGQSTGFTDMNLFAQKTGTFSQSAATGVNNGGFYNGLGNIGFWYGSLIGSSTDRLGVVAVAANGVAFTLTTAGSTKMRVTSQKCPL
jgi:hypothetical protein